MSVTGGGGGTQPAETQLSLPSIGGGSQGTNDKRSSRQPSDDAGNALPAGPADSEDGGGDSLRISIDSDSDDDWAADGPKEPTKKKKTPFGAIGEWIDDYKTRKSGYGPPYYSEYGGDLPGDCNRMGADLLEIDELLRNGADPNVGQHDHRGFTPIHFAAKCGLPPAFGEKTFGNVELLKMLKRAGGKPDVTNALGLTPLSCSCAFKLSLSAKGGDPAESKHVAAVNWLLDQGADPNHVDKAGYTPLAWACRSGVYPVVAALVEAGADVMQRRPKLPGESQVCLPKADPLAVTTDKQIERYLQAKINTILQREAAMIRHEGKVDCRTRRLKEIQEAIARKKEARMFIIQEKKRVKETEELSFELMKADKAEEARRARRDWLRLMKVSPGIWAKIEASAEGRASTTGGDRGRSPLSPGSKRKPRPRWVFDTSMAVSTKDAAAHDVLEEARQVEAFILNGVQKQKILAPRWRAMTGKRLLRLEHGQRLGAAAKGNDRRGLERDHAGGGGGGSGGVPLSGLEEEGSDTSSSSGGSDRAG